MIIFKGFTHIIVLITFLLFTISMFIIQFLKLFFLCFCCFLLFFVLHGGTIRVLKFETNIVTWNLLFFHYYVLIFTKNVTVVFLCWYMISHCFICLFPFLFVFFFFSLWSYIPLYYLYNFFNDFYWCVPFAIRKIF